MNAADPNAHAATPKIDSLYAANVRDLAKSFSGRSVLDKLNWSIPHGRVIGLLGRNGAGKTTLLECLLGLQEPDEGLISLYDESPANLTAQVKSRLGYVPQQAEMFDWMTATEMLAFIGSHYPKWNREKVASLMDRWSIKPHQVIKRLSVGERQRLSIIRALGHEPDFLVLDEPVASLDPAARREFLREIVDLSIDSQTTVVFSTHILSDLERVAFDLAILHAGRILIEGAIDSLVREVARVHGNPGRLSAMLPFALRKQFPGEEHLIVRLPSAGFQIAPGLRVEPLGLEDLFIEVTQ